LKENSSLRDYRQTPTLLENKKDQRLYGPDPPIIKAWTLHCADASAGLTINGPGGE
jgi:hypothetical protein